MFHERYQNAVRRRGASIPFFLVILSVLITGLLGTMALNAGMNTQMASLTLKRDQAFYAAEVGIQRAYWLLQNDNNWRTDAAPLTGTVGNASYTVTATGEWNAPVLISAQASVPGGVATTISAVCTPATIVPTISLGNNFDNNGNATINGDVEAKGNIRTTGRFVLNGGLRAGGTISTSGSVDISGGQQQGVTDIEVPTIDVNALVAQATTVVKVPQGLPKTYEVDYVDFGNGGIVYFDGPIMFKGKVTIKGRGTLVVNGSVTIHSAASFGSSAEKAQANIVATGKMDVSGYLGIVGSMYVGTDLVKNGGLDVTGVIVAQRDLGTSGGLTITRAKPPWFDPRADTSGAGSINLTTFTGPIFW